MPYARNAERVTGKEVASVLNAEQTYQQLKMKTRLITITGIFLILLSLSPFAVHAQAEGFIEGRLFNRTVSGSNTGGQPVTLIIYLDDIETGTRDTLTDNSGSFRFEGLDTTPGFSYRVQTSFQSVDYNSEKLEFVEGSANLTTILPVFDSTENDNDIVITSSHVIIYVNEGQLYITEFLMFRNDSDRTYIGKPYSGNVSQRETLRLSLPMDAQDLQIGNEFTDSYIRLDSGGFIDTVPVQPGTREMAFSYVTEYVDGEYTYLQDVFYPIGSMEVLVNGNVSITESELMAENEPFQSQGESFQHYTASGLTPGQQLSLVLSETASTGQINPFWIVVTVVLMIAAVLLVYYLRRGKGVVLERKETGDDVEELLNIIASLDDNYENGIIDENEYRELRDKYKNSLADLMEEPDGD